uniref:Ig-like domain-containing protein n=1 Tax=Leptobrachium leishanense TaxID=445787 RepID=A0A8C5QKZ3_9ANUR
MTVSKKIFILIFLQGFHCVSLGQTWTFPESMEALLGSCVVIPCTVTKAITSTSHGVVWFVYHRSQYIQIFNSRETSGIRAENKQRTSLASAEPDSCSLRINNVRREDADSYYPGIDEKTNSYYNEGTIKLNIRVSPRDVRVNFNENDEIKEGDDVTLTCSSVSNPSPTSYEWYRGKERIKVPDESKQSIKVWNVNFQNEIYSCSAENQIGKTESPQREIQVQHVAKNVEVVLRSRNGNTEAKCDFSSSRPPVTSYSWFKDNIPMINQTEQTITMANKEFSSGEYHCIAHNGVGSSSSSVKTHSIIEAEEEYDLPLILGSMAGVIMLLLFMLVLYIYIRQRRVKQGTEGHGAVPFKFPVSHTTNADNNAACDHFYDNVNPTSDTTRLNSSGEAAEQRTGDDNHVVYTNYAMTKDSDQDEIEYAVINHTKHKPKTQHRVTFNISHTEDTEYATVKTLK